MGQMHYHIVRELRHNNYHIWMYNRVRCTILYYCILPEFIGFTTAIVKVTWYLLHEVRFGAFVTKYLRSSHTICIAVY